MDIFDFLNDEGKVIVASYVLSFLNRAIPPPPNFKRYATVAGASPIRGINYTIDKKATVGTGFYTYNSHTALTQTYDTSKIKMAPWFFIGS